MEHHCKEYAKLFNFPSDLIFFKKLIALRIKHLYTHSLYVSSVTDRKLHHLRQHISDV